ncbi:uncharacterized protein LOC106130851 [Amyelois transitella]|uniref:uncharacterized protein LOC106130851 n=1 Tax=Amyelois transitella TaxID=680683 RepID=UPI00299049F5|nr:uncharacterized protein LOC106130851 [Amyelois transitella]
MASNEEIERIIDSLAFEVEAVPQNNILEVSGTSKATPLNLKIRVRKKDEALFKQGVVSVPKLGHSKKSPEKIRLVSSDQTVLSFKVFVDTDPDKKPVKKRKRFFGGCLSSEDNEDDTYMDSSKIVATKSSEIVKHNFGLSKNIQDMQLHTQKPTMFFGKTCKPGGCLDPPFDEEIYSYEPKACSKISVQSNTEINKHDSTTLQYPYIDTKYSDMYITNSSSKMGKENNVIEKLSGSHSPERENIKDIQRNESDNNISESYTSDSKKILTKLYPGEIVTEKSRDLDLEIESKNMLRSGKDNDDDENKSISEISLQNKHIKDNEFIDVSEEHKDILGLGSDNIDLQSKTNPSLQNIQDNDENVVTTCLKAGGALTIPILMAGVAKQITTTNHHNGDLSNENEPSDINKEIQKNVNEHLNKNEQSFLINSNGGKKIVTDSLSLITKN